MKDVITSHYQKLQLKNAISEIKLVKGNQSPKAHTTAQIVPTLVRKGISNPLNEQIDYINQMIQVNCKHIRILEQRRATNEQVYSQSMTTLTHHCIDIGTRMAQSENRLQQATEDNYLLKEEMEQTTEEYRESCRQFEEDQRIQQQSYASISGIHKRYPSQQQFKSVMQHLYSKQNLSIHPRGAAYPSNDQDIVQLSRNHQTARQSTIVRKSYNSHVRNQSQSQQQQLPEIRKSMHIQPNKDLVLKSERHFKSQFEH